MRESLEESWSYLESLGRKMPRDVFGRPLVPPSMPSYDDEEPRFSFFRTWVEDTDLSALRLPRTYFGRSLLQRVKFANTDLSESRMCWNDFEQCDFSGTDLSGCDMRASLFTGCKFVEAVLRGADLRRSYFKGCDFTRADLTGAVAEDGILYTRSGHTGVADFLTREQQAVMTWTPDEGPMPPGG